MQTLFEKMDGIINEWKYEPWIEKKNGNGFQYYAEYHRALKPTIDMKGKTITDA